MTEELLNDGGPFLQAAMLCEHVLDEKDGVKSAIRIIDRMTRTVVNPNPPQTMESFQYAVKMLLKFKSGRARGSQNLEIRLTKPMGDSPAPMVQRVYFEGEDDRGIDIVVNFHINVEEPGLYWFDIKLEGKRVTRIPLRVIYMPQIIQMPPPSGGSQPHQESPPET